MGKFDRLIAQMSNNIRDAWYEIGCHIMQGIMDAFMDKDVWGFNSTFTLKLRTAMQRQRAAISPTLSLIVFLVGFVVLMEVF